MGKWEEIHTLRLQGLGIKAIARKLGISKHTVRRALQSDSPPEIKRKRTSFSTLQLFEKAITTFRDQKLIGTRILHELRKLGYSGSQATLYNYLNMLKKEESTHKIKERYETQPGQQGQFDWSYYTVGLGGQLAKIVVFCLILSYSRRKFYFPSLNETQLSVFEAIEKGLWWFGGAPKELLIDNARVFINNPHPTHFTWNAHFLEFCSYYHLKPVACKIRRAQTKGKVERPFFYLENHFIKGRTFTHFEDLSRKLFDFSCELDIMTHCTTGFRPIDRFEEEKELLIQLPPKTFMGTFELIRKVSWDCLVSIGGTRYSVPYRFAGKQVWVKVSQGRNLLIFSLAGELIASHPIASKNTTVINKSHYEGLRKQTPKALSLLKKSFLEQFPESSLFLEKLLAQYKFHPHRHLKEILELTNFYPKEKIVEAMGVACEYNTFSHSFIKGILREKDLLQEPLTSPMCLENAPKLNIKRELTTYQKFLEEEEE